MFEMGFVVGLGLLFTLYKVDWRTRMWMISHALVMDVLVFTFLTLVHWGTFSGVMVASIGALFCSVTLSLARWLVGHVESTAHGRVYYSGVFNVAHKLK